MIFNTLQLMSDNLFSRMFIHFLSFQFILPEKNDTVLENLSIINIILSRLMSVINSIKMKLIMIILNS